MWCEALREKRRNLCRRLSSENPTKAELKFLAMAPGVDGRASWRFPNVWNLDDEDGHYRQVILHDRKGSCSPSSLTTLIGDSGAPHELGRSKEGPITSPSFLFGLG